MVHFQKKSLLLTLTFLLIAAVVSAGETVIEAAGNHPYTAQLIFAAAPLATMTDIPFRIELRQNGSGSDIRSGVCDLTMPAMPMPENRPVLNCSGQRCRGRAIFTMAGAWQARCDLILDNDSKISPVFRIDKVRMK